MNATVECYEVTEKHPFGELAELSTGRDDRIDERMLYLAIDGQRIAYISTNALTRLAQFWAG